MFHIIIPFSYDKLEYCERGIKMRLFYRHNTAKRFFLCWLSLFLILAIAAVSCLIHIKPFVFKYARSQAESILLSAANNAILQVLKTENITYDGISRVTRDESGTIKGIEIDIGQANILKSSISSVITEILAKESIYDLYIPVGTLLGSEFTTGFGNKIHFRMQLTETSVVDFKNSFVSAGINSVLHRIIIDINISACILMMGCTEDFSVHTTAIAAQTVIAGKVPDSFTNVVEEPGDDVADKIFNFAGLD